MNSARTPSPFTAGRAWLWAVATACLAFVPFAAGLSDTRIFYTRDLSMYFWPRYLWLRRGWRSGEWPLWDPFVGAGQAAYSDPLHQMFLPPAILARLAGGEVLGFNLWVALPFPIAAVGAWAFLARRFSPVAAAIGAVGFGLCGPVVSSSNFPNSAWCVAALPWVLWATDRVVSTRRPRDYAALALAVAGQCLAGEPVTMFVTLAMAGGYALVVGAPDGPDDLKSRALNVGRFGLGTALGLALGAIQVIPMIAAARIAERSDTISAYAWSLRPTALLETIWLHLFGDYFRSQSLTEVPWMPLMFTGREPFFFSIYFGIPLLALAIFGLAGTAPRRWRLFWTIAGFTSVVAAFGSYTPIYPILRDHVPPFGSFRFPVKYIIVAAMAVAAGAAAGWETLSPLATRAAGDERRARRARGIATGFALGTGLVVGVLGAVAALSPDGLAASLQSFAVRAGDESGTAGDAMVRTFREDAWPIAIVAVAAGLLMLVASRGRGRGRLAQTALAALMAGDLVVRAWGINPHFDAAHVAEPAWLAHTKADPHARFYVGGKYQGTLTTMDVDATRGYTNASGLTGSASRAALNIQAAFYPSGWQGREMLSYDLPVLWPRAFTLMMERFLKSPAVERERFLDRTGVRYRILPQRRAPGRTPIMPIPQFQESFLFDWGNGVAPRVSVVPRAEIVTDPDDQVDALFEREHWDVREVMLIDREVPPAGAAGPAAAAPFARIVEDRSNRTRIETGVGTGGGYLLFLDCYSDDWRLTVDGIEAAFVRANGLFRGVRLAEGTHTVEFAFRPPSLIRGAATSAAALIAVIALVVRRTEGRTRPGRAL